MALDNDGVNIIITGDASQAIRELGRIEQSINSLLSFEVGSKLETGFGSLFQTIANGFQRIANLASSVMKSALAVGGSFESQMTTVKVISGATGEEIAQLTAKAREMGSTLPITAKDAATAMTLLVQRGTSFRDTLASVNDVANLAISQGVSMAEATDLLGGIMTNFNIKAEEAGKAVNILNNASNQSPLTIAKMQEAFKYVGPAAGAMGISLTEATAAMEAVISAVGSAEMTGTGISVVLSKIAAKSRIMGVETKNLDGSFRSLADIFSELNAKGFTLADAIAIFGARGSKAALALANQSATLKENEERLKQWGTTQSAVDEKAKTFTNTMMALSSAIEAIHIEIFEQIKTQSKDAVSGVTELVRTLSEWVGQTKIAEKAVNAFLEGLRFNIPAGTDFKKFLDKLDVQAIVEKVKSFAATIRSIADSIVLFASNIKTPLLFLIEHLDTFATISFWGWITGKAMQIPAIVISLASSFTQLYSVLKTLTTINLTKVLAFLANPAVATAGIAAMSIHEVMSKMNEAYSSLIKSVGQERRYIQEQAQADSSLEWDINLNIRTGFEKLPQSWTKASDELREKANHDVKVLQEAFREKVGKAVQAVTAKFPDMAEALRNSAEVISNSSLRKITQALQGNKDAFDAMPPHLQKVTEQLYYMGIQAGQTTGSFGEIIDAYRELQKQINSSKISGQNEVSVFTQELTSAVKNLIDEMPDNIDRLQKFLGGNNLELPIRLSMAQANNQLQELSKSIGEKFNVPQEIVSSVIFVRLQALAEKGNKTAQSLRNGWNNSTEALDNFMATAQDAVNYLKVSPEKFTPALNNLMKGIQKIDPLTGKVTEQFKKAYEALKQWSNITFDQLAQRIQRIRKAVEGGLINQSALNAEFQRVSQQVKLQVVTELQPSRSSYQSQEAFNSVVASEYVSRMGELGGQAFMDLLQREFASLYDKSGSAIGAAIMRQVDRDASSGSISMKINGVEMAHQSQQSQGSINYQNFTKAFSDSVSPVMAKLEQLTNLPSDVINQASTHFGERASGVVEKLRASLEDNSSNLARVNETMLSFVSSITNSNSQAASMNYPSEFSEILKEIRILSAGINDNVNAVNSVRSAVVSVENAVKSINAGNNYDIDINQQGFITDKRADADLIARNTISALRLGIGNGGV